MHSFDSQMIYNNYEVWKENKIYHRLFKPEDIEKIILRLRENEKFHVNHLGLSVEGRNIYSVQWGRGETSILLWSQMHGDEPTATMAFMDIFKFLQDDIYFSEFKTSIHQKLTLHFIPVLNPDGAAKYQRRNAMEIDINRDAIRKQTPEARILEEYRKRIQPDWAFNMHDQRKYHTVENTLETATISLLAPSYDKARSVNEIRSDAMKLAGVLFQELNPFLPGKMARYTDKFYPTSFGDNFQKFNVRSVLVEAGGYPGDPEKQYIRKLHFLLLLCGFHSIAHKTFKAIKLGIYGSIPENSEFLYDLIIRNADLVKNGHSYRVDLAFKTEEIAHQEHWNFIHKSTLVDLGDLSAFHGYKEFDAAGFDIKAGKVFYEVILDPGELSDERCLELLSQGFTEIRVKKLDPGTKLKVLPVRLVPDTEKFTFELLVGKNPSLIFEKNGEIRYAVVNGFLIQL